MRKLLRSMIVVNNDPPEESFRNFIKFSESGMGFEGAHEIRLWEIIRDFGQEHGHSPTDDSLRNILKLGTDVDVQDFLEILIKTPPIFKGDFFVHLEEMSNERKVRQVKDLLAQTNQILNTGIEQREGKDKKVFKGPIDAARYFYEKVPEIVAPTTGGRIYGEILHDRERGIQDYLTVKADPRAGIGQFTGIAQIDKEIKGAKRSELWTHAAFTGHGKSLFARNWAYNQAVFMGYNVLYLSLEMYYKQMRNHFYSMHSAHSKFNDIRMELGIQKDPRIVMGTPYGLIREGELNPAEEIFLLQHVIPDLESSPEYGSIFLEVADPDKDEMTVSDLRARAEVLDRKNPLDLIIVDHALLLNPRRRTKSTTEDLNQVMRDLKKLSMSFARGRGIPVVALFQISREGYKHAEKAGGTYNLTHLSYANECCVAGTLVALSTGWTPIEQVRPGAKVWSRSGWKNVLDFFPQGVREIVEVTTTVGSFKVTPDHRLRVWDGKDFVWIHAKDLNSESIIPLPTDYSPEQELGFPESYLLGVHMSRPERTIQSLFTYGHYGLRMGIRKSLQAAFGDAVLHPINFTPMQASQSQYRELVEEWVPSHKFRSLGADSIICLLRGVADASGSVDPSGNIRLATEPVHSENIQSLLLMLGIQSKRANSGLISIIESASIERFANKIGFSHSPFYRDAQFSDSPVERTIPVCDEYRQEFGLASSVSEEDLHGIDLDESHPLTTIRGMLWTRVLSVTPQPSEEVYDIEVDGDHEYMTEFHLAHNCERSSDIVTASWLNDELKAKNRIQFQCLKVRDGGSFDPFYSRIDFTVGRMFTCDEVPLTKDQQKALGDEIDNDAADGLL